MYYHLGFLFGTNLDLFTLIHLCCGLAQKGKRFSNSAYWFYLQLSLDSYIWIT